MGSKFTTDDLQEKKTLPPAWIHRPMSSCIIINVLASSVTRLIKAFACEKVISAEPNGAVRLSDQTQD